MNDVVISPDETLDCSGLNCPMPVIKTSQAMKKLAAGQVLKVISTDAGSMPDMEAWAKQTGHEMMDAHKENGQFFFYFRHA